MKYKFSVIFSTLDGKGGFGHNKQSKDEFFYYGLVLCSYIALP